jgi:hypothetical protein
MRVVVSRLALAILYGVQSIHFSAFARESEAFTKAKAIEQVVESWGQSKSFGELLNKIDWDKSQKEALRKAFVKDGLFHQKLPQIEHSRENDIVWLSWGEKTAKVLLVSLDPVVIYADYKGFEFSRSMSIVDFYSAAKKQINIENPKTVYLNDFIRRLLLPEAEAKSKGGTNWAWLGSSLGLIVLGIGSFAYLNYKEGAKPGAAPATSAETPPPNSEPHVPVQKPRIGDEPKKVAPKIEEKPKLVEESLNKVGEIEKLIKEVQVQNNLFAGKFECTDKYGALLAFEKEGSNPRLRYQISSMHPNTLGSQRLGSEVCAFEFDEKGGSKVVKGKNCMTDKELLPTFSQNGNVKVLITKVGSCCEDQTCKDSLEKLVKAETEKHGVVSAADSGEAKHAQ